VAFSIYDGEQVLVNYVTDGSNEPYCIALDDGNYRITRSSQPDEELTTDGEWAISVSPGSEQDFEFGSYTDESSAVAAAEADATRSETAAMAIPGDEEAAAQEANGQDEGGMTRWIVIAAVVVAVLLFIGVLIIILSGRRATI
jgi:hypothetical protein